MSRGGNFRVNSRGGECRKKLKKFVALTLYAIFCSKQEDKNKDIRTESREEEKEN